MPGPDVVVMARAPAHPAPMTIPIAANSSSAWTTAKVAFPSGPIRNRFRYSIMLSAREDEGVIGYQLNTVHPAKTQPRAEAELPSMMIFPRFLSIRSMRYGSAFVRLAVA